ncbi:ABC transporter permease subunit [Xylophilus rhododendri]|uniref:ABC transporter permease subunit n=1 Tax=Xylophilus rhododendri TaxID=2697032 RepID=A0A857JCF4_9BURK|nr:ABC transporter permease [Xylophilus rhododendri]QHJ00643.1 ABC transporter permease subunit [Xylophilus rhododendri]
MTAFIARRLLGLLVTLAAMAALVFWALDILPGNAAQMALGPDAAPEAVRALATQMGLDQPAWSRFLHWLLALLHGDLGTSASYGDPVSTLIAERLALTVPLALLAMLLTCVLALAVGVTAAARHRSGTDTTLMAITQIGVAVPNFWLAILLVLLFAVKLQWFSAGGFDGWDQGIAEGLRALWLPAVALAAVQAAILARFTRSAVLETLREDYVRTARAKGLSERAILWKHVLRNAAVPVVTVMGLQFAELLAGAIVVENVFTLPGLGRLVFQAIGNRDLPLVRGCVMLLATLVVLVNFAVDVLYAAIDPRLRGAAR